jgi:hypothetical protein
MDRVLDPQWLPDGSRIAMALTMDAPGIALEVAILVRLAGLLGIVHERGLMRGVPRRLERFREMTWAAFKGGPNAGGRARTDDPSEVE